MRSRMKSTVSAADVKAVATDWIQQHLQLRDHKRKCTAAVILSVLYFAASRRKSIHDACMRLAGVPSDEIVRTALRATLPPQADLETRINAALGDRLPKAFFKNKRGQRIAIDFTLIPYHGQPACHEREIRRGQPKHGTTHFHAYATAYVVQHGQRYTLAMTYVFGDEHVKDVVQRLLQQVRALGVKVRFLLVDKEFFNVDVVRYLQAARYPFLMPAFARGRKPKRPRSDSLHALAARKCSGWGRYSWKSHAGKRATVNIAIVCRNYRGQRGRHGRRTQLYAYWGLRPGTARWVHETYRKRFGIESSYRQLNECRIRTSTRKPLFRLLFVGFALILRNVWVWCHLNWLADRRGRGIYLRSELLRLGEMTLWLQHLAEVEFGLVLMKIIPRPPDE